MTIRAEDFERYYADMTNEERKIADDKVMSIWLCPELTDPMVKYIGFKLLESSCVNVINVGLKEV
jgi:hypothetical protein